MVKKTIRKHKKTKISHKKLIFFMGMIVCMALIIGYICGKMGVLKSCPKCNDQTIKNLVINPDKKVQLSICGLVRPSEACIFYVLNNNVYDKIGEDFFEEVAQKTQRMIYHIRINNVLYAKMPIPSGRFAEIIVPALK